MNLYQNTLSDWENLVAKQLKTEDIYQVLQKGNLENITLKPLYNSVNKTSNFLPKLVENTHLITNFKPELVTDYFAFIINEENYPLQDKILFTESIDFNLNYYSEKNECYFIKSIFNPSQDNLEPNTHKIAQSDHWKRSFCIDISFLQNCGASIIQQVAIALAQCKEYIENYGEEIIDKIIIKTAIGSSYLFEIAKVRALKLVFLELSKQYNKKQLPFIYAETTLRNKTKSNTENNLIRSTLELGAAMIGGADALFSNNYNLDQNLQTENSTQEIANKQHIILAYESILNVFEDAANGSYAIEDFTKQIADKAWKFFIEIEERGGYLANTERIKKEVILQAKSEQNWVKNGKISLIGVNLYPTLPIIKSVDELYPINVYRTVRWAEMYGE